MDDCKLKYYFTNDNTSYYIDENGWSYMRENNGPFRIIEAAKPTLWDRIKWAFKRKNGLKLRPFQICNKNN